MSERTSHALDVLYSRWSCRKFSDKSVAREQIEKIVKAGQLAVSARNVHPWHFVAVYCSRLKFAHTHI